MASIARTSSVSVARLAASFRHAVTMTNPRQAALSSCHAGPSSRTFRTSTALASSSSSPTTPSDSSTSVEASSEAEVTKPKRKRRSKDEIEAAKMAKLALGISGRRKRRTRTAIGTVAFAQGATNNDATQAKAEPKRRGRPRTKPESLAAAAKAKAGVEEVEVEDRNASDAGAVEEVLDREEMEKLLTQMEYAHLPPRNEWKMAFPNAKQHQTSYRYFMSNRATIRDIISQLGIQDPERNGEKVTIVEGYPGPGTFASEFLQLPEVEKVIGLEETPRYLQKLEVLQSQLEDKQPGGGQRLDMLESSAYMWDTYTQLVSSGKLGHLNNRVSNSDGSMVDFTTNDFIPPDHTDASWQKLSPMIFFAQLPNTVYGEQLFAQIIAAIASRIWLFRHGRIQLGFICGESLARRCLAEAGDKISRGKLGTTVQCLADVQVHKYAHELQPHSHHFFPPTMSVGPRVTVSGTSLIPNSNPSTGLTRMGMVMMTVTPKQKPLIKAGEIEAFEYITRNLFILRTKSIGEALTHVAPGGQNVLKMTSPQQVEKGLIQPEEVILPHEIVGELSNVQWACLARMFEKWPFRPRHLFEEGRVKVDNKGRN